MRSLFKKLEQLAVTTHAFARRHWRKALQIREKLQFSEETFHLLLAGGVGVIGGMVNLVFHAGMVMSEKLFTNQVGDIVAVSEGLEKWHRLLIPTVGGSVAGLVLFWGLRLVGKQRSSNLLEVVSTSDGRLPFRSAIVKATSSLVSIGSGESIGREGAITQLAATFASKWGQVAHWQPYRLRMLTACGAASGIAAAYNAPITGAVFAALIVLGNFSMNLFAPLVFSSVIASMVSRSFFGMKPWYTVPQFEFTSLLQLPWFVVLGIGTGMMGAVFLKMLHWGQGVFQKLKAPIYVRRMALGGLAVGLISVQYPQVWGNGYGVTNEILTGQFLTQYRYPLLFLVGVFLAKLMATMATVGSGAVGGVITPTLFLGAGLGCILGTSLHLMGQGAMLPTGAFALVGMGSMLAATTRSPLLAMIMAFEISPDLLADAGADAGMRHFNPGGAPVASGIHLYRATAKEGADAGPGKPAARFGHGTNGGRFDARAGSADCVKQRRFRKLRSVF